MELLEQIVRAGVVGLGGAGFPTGKKLDCRVEWLIVNGAECEPLLRTDRYLMRHNAGRVIRAAGAVARMVAVSCLVGSNAVKSLLDTIPEFIKHGLSVATGIIPALGFAMLARLLINKKVAPYFFLGFVLMAYLKIPVTGIAILGAIVAVVMVNVTALNSPRITTEQGVSDDDEDDF